MPLHSDKFPQDSSLPQLRKELRREFRNVYSQLGGVTGGLPLPPGVMPTIPDETPSGISWDFGSLASPTGPSVDFGDLFLPLSLDADFGAI